VPLLEIVSEPDMRTGAEAAAYGAEIRRIVRFVGASNGNMQVGQRASVAVDPAVSLVQSAKDIPKDGGMLRGEISHDLPQQHCQPT